MRSAKIPAAVTAAPAPGPCTTRGCGAYLLRVGVGARVGVGVRAGARVRVRDGVRP